MILDDDRHVRKSLAMMLEDEGYDITEVESAEDAMKTIEQEQFALIIVDLRLPGMNGTEFIDKAMERWANLHFIIYTGSPEFRVPSSLASASAVSDSVFLKPMTGCEDMVAEIERMLG